MLMDGQSAGTYHNWGLTTPILKKELEDTGLFQVTVVTFPAFPGGDFSNFKPEFSKYGVIVSNLDSPDWPAELKAQFENYVRTGGGVVIVHAADNAFPDWPAYNQMIGIGGWRGRTETAGPRWYYQNDKLVSDPSPGSAGMHGQRLSFQVTTRDPKHPIMKGFPPIWMHANDELYGKLRGPGQNMDVLATAHSLVTNNGTGNDEPMLMALKYGKGRIFQTAMGHDVTALSCVGFIATYQRGTEWAATGRVTQEVPSDFPGPDKVSIRADIAAVAPTPADAVK
jgi:type 1 glutamine amidotransferase